MECSEIYGEGDNSTHVFMAAMAYRGNFSEFNNSEITMYSHQSRIYDTLGDYITGLMIPLIFAFGIAGNSANLVVLGRKKIRRGLNHIERSALSGLISLSLSDLALCVVGFPVVFLRPQILQNASNLVRLLAFSYGLYRTPLLNIFLFTSTWLIIWVSMERYMAVCHPFQARIAIRPRRSSLAHFLILAIGVFINIPLFLKYSITAVATSDSCAITMYYLQPSPTTIHNPMLVTVHRLTWAVLGTFLPLLCLLFCNINILRAISTTDAMLSGDSSNNRTFSRVTMTLVLMMFLYLTLVTPSMFLAFLQDGVLNMSGHQLAKYQLCLHITNLCQAGKFASNFLLYCVTNKQFRKDVSGAMCKKTSSRSVAPGSSTARQYQLLGTLLTTPSDNRPSSTSSTQISGLGGSSTCAGSSGGGAATAGLGGRETTAAHPK